MEAYNMRPEFIVAVKEFKDYLSNKVFLAIFGLLVLITIASVVAGMGTYNDRLTSYNSILSTASRNATAFQPEMPSMMVVFESFNSIFVIAGWVLAIIIGFSLISKEKETGSLKLLLARPIFRDSIINGKILGATSILVISLAAAFLVAVAVLLFEGIVPSGDDLTRLVLFFLMIVLFSLSFLAISIAASAISKNSTMAILLALVIAVFSLMVPYFTDSIGQVAMGQAPTMLLPATGNSTSGTSSTNFPGDGGGFTINAGGRNNTVQMRINPEYTSYWNTRNQITEAIDLVSPTSDLTGIALVVVNGQQSPLSNSGGGQFNFRQRGMSSPTLGNTLSSILPQVLALLVMTIAGFGISYAKFIRMDVRSD
jgi:ABC-2 type transport system permease protein